MSYRALLFFVITVLLPLQVFSAETIKIQVDQTNSGTEIKISGDNKLKSAVFLRNNKIWFAADKLYEVNFSGLNTRYKTITRFDKIKNEKTIFYFQIDDLDKYEISMSRNESDVFIKINPYDPSIAPEELVSPRQIIRHTENSDNQVEIQSYEEKPSIIKLIDPFVGDELFIIPEQEIARSNNYRFVDFKILPSLSGVVINSLSDDLKVDASNYLINISSKNYLNISSSNRVDNMRSKALLEILDTSSYSILDIRRYEANEALFNPTLENIYHRINMIHDHNLKSYKFLNLALFFMANSWYVESKGVFELIHNSSDIVDKIYQIKLMIGVNYLMCNDFINGYRIIDSINIDNVQMKDRNEIRFWKNFSAVAFATNNKNSFDKEFIELLLRRIIKKCISYKSNFLSSYPTKLLNNLFFITLQLASDLNKPGDIKLLTETISKTKLDEPSLEKIKYYSARALLANGDDKKAFQKLEDCSKSPDLYLYSHCKFELLKALSKNNRINKTDYINGLQSISTVWRGDKFEVEVLETLGETYMSMNDISNAIRIWRIISSNDPSSYSGFTGYAKAGKIFIESFQNKLNGSPLDKLSFFYEFKDLIPLGEIGDTITIDASSYMIDLDLVEQAGKVIEYQIKNRLLGITKEKMINDLAELYLKNKNFNLSEQAIVDWSVLPFNTTNPFIEERKYLYVESLIGLEQYQDAVAVLYGDVSPRADELRAKAYFAMGDWDGFNDNSEPYIYNLRFSKKNSSIVDGDYVKILRQNIAYFNNNQMELLDNLYLDMKSRFSKGQKNAERNKIFYNIANDLKSPGIVFTKDYNQRINALVSQIMNS